MPRKPRIDLPNHLYHVIIRGIEQRPIYKDRKDYQEFIFRLMCVFDECGGKCFAWALMPNHAHLLMRSGRQGLSEMMRRLLTGYAVYFNIRHKRAGHLFQNRFKSTLCDKDEYLLQLVRYIHLNPLKAGIVRTFEALASYPWTGHKALIEGNPVVWHDYESVLGMFGNQRRKALDNYMEYLKDGIQEEVDFEGGGLIRSKTHGKGMIITGRIPVHQLFDERILGDTKFIKGIYSSGSFNESDAQYHQDGRKSFEKIIDQIALKYKMDRDMLLNKNVSRTATKIRPLLAYIGVHKLGLTNTTISQFLHITNSSVCKMLSRNRKLFNGYQNKTVSDIINQ